MKHKHLTVAGVLLALAMIGAPAAALAGDAGERVGGTVEESVRTGAHAVRDGVLTFGRTVRDFFTGGTNAARETWRENADRTKENARDGAANVRGEANR
jgi:hypothetical protein